jgi:hypothetical protein
MIRVGKDGWAPSGTEFCAQLKEIVFTDPTVLGPTAETEAEIWKEWCEVSADWVLAEAEAAA